MSRPLSALAARAAFAFVLASAGSAWAQQTSLGFVPPEGWTPGLPGTPGFEELPETVKARLSKEHPAFFAFRSDNRDFLANMNVMVFPGSPPSLEAVAELLLSSGQGFTVVEKKLLIAKGVEVGRIQASLRMSGVLIHEVIYVVPGATECANIIFAIDEEMTGSQLSAFDAAAFATKGLHEPRRSYETASFQGIVKSVVGFAVLFAIGGAVGAFKKARTRTGQESWAPLMIPVVVPLGLAAIVGGGYLLLPKSQGPTSTSSPAEAPVVRSPEPVAARTSPVPGTATPPSPPPAAPTPPPPAPAPLALPASAPPVSEGPTWQQFSDLGWVVSLPCNKVELLKERLDVTTRKRQTLRLECEAIQVVLEKPARTYWAASIRLMPNMGTQDEVFSMMQAALAGRWKAERAEPKPVGASATVRAASSDIAGGKGRLHVRLSWGGTFKAVVAVVDATGEIPDEAQRVLDAFPK